MEFKNNKYSINPHTRKKYSIPDFIDDSVGIDKFLSNNQGKKVIVVQGLGFVGAVMSLVCANAINGDYAVIGVDLANENTFWKIKSINEGVFPIVASDPKIDLFYKNSMEKGNFYATYDPYAYSKANVVIVDINLDVEKKSHSNGDLNSYDVSLNGFEKAIKEIGKFCKEDVLILIETTVPPGTTSEVVFPIIKKSLIDRGLSNSKFKLGHSYERVMPGPNYIDSIQNFYRVYSGINKKSADSLEIFLKTIISTKNYPLTRLGNTNSTEMAKVLENSFRAMNIAFVVEWSRFAEEAGVNFYEVVDAIRMRPTHKNLMYPGIGVGGYCLTKDPLLASWSRQNIFNSNEPLIQSERGVKINDKMPYYAFQFLIKELNNKVLKNKNILLLGVSYRSNVGDTRYSPVEPFYNYLKSENAKIYLHDPYVGYWEEKKIEIPDKFENAFKSKLDIVVVSTAHEEYKNSNILMTNLMQSSKLFIFDTVGLFSEREIQILSKKHKLRVLGRGDIN